MGISKLARDYQGAFYQEEQKDSVSFRGALDFELYFCDLHARLSTCGLGDRTQHQLNAELQRIARRYKKAFLSEQFKEIKENNRMGKTRNLFMKTRNIKGTFHAKMGTIKDRNDMDLTEAEDIKEEVARIHRTIQKKTFMSQITTIV